MWWCFHEDMAISIVLLQIQFIFLSFRNEQWDEEIEIYNVRRITVPRL